MSERERERLRVVNKEARKRNRMGSAIVNVNVNVNVNEIESIPEIRSDRDCRSHDMAVLATAMAEKQKTRQNFFLLLDQRSDNVGFDHRSDNRQQDSGKLLNLTSILVRPKFKSFENLRPIIIPLIDFTMKQFSVKEENLTLDRSIKRKFIKLILIE